MIVSFSETELTQSHQKQLEFWFQSALGRNLLANQRVAIERKIRGFYGVHQAEMGVSHRVPVGNPSNLAHKFFVLLSWESDLPENTIISSADEIALESDSVDMVILHHTLDFSSNPHQTLREAARILKSSGHLIIVGFNPLSLWGCRKLFLRSKTAPWNSRFISGKRVEDWLNLLDFNVFSLDYFYYGLPFNRVGLKNKSFWLDNILNSKVPLGAYYTLIAEKQVGSHINVTRQWRRQANVIGIPFAEAANATSAKPN